MKKRMLAILLVLMMVIGLIGCTQSKNSTQGSKAVTDGTGAEGTDKAEEKGKPTPATIILYGEASQRMTEFAANEFHQKVLDAINVDVTVQYLPWTEYATGKTELMLSSGEKFVTYTDTAFMAKCVAKGYYADLTDIAEKYAGDLKANCGGDEAFNTWKVDGKLYALPFGNKPNAGEDYVVIAREDILKDVGMTDLKTMEDLEKFYQLAKEKYPDIVGLSRGVDPDMFNGAIASDKNVYRLNNFIFTDGNKPDDSTVYDYYSSQEYKEVCEITNKWNKMGIIPSYALSNPSQSSAEFNSGKSIFTTGASYRVFEFMDTVRKSDPKAVFKNYYIGDKSKKPLMSRGTYSTAFAISANVEGAELEGYVKLINLLQSSQDWVDFILYGEKGKDYNIKDDGTLEMINTDTLFDTWLPDNINFKRYQNYITKDQIDTYAQWNEGCIAQKDIGFSFDMTPVSAEYAQLQAVEQEFFQPITFGFVDYDTAIEGALKKLKDAGIDKFVQEYQKQFQAFYDRKSKN